MAFMNLRRLRNSALTRSLHQSAIPRVEQLIQPLFVVEGISKKEPISGLSGVFRETPSSLLKQIEMDLKNGVHHFILFGVPKKKTSRPQDPSFMTSQIKSIRKHFGKDLWLAIDVCLCSYTESGHCGILNPQKTCIQNKESVAILSQFALAFAQAGADAVAPSDMMDGRIQSIRTLLDQEGQENTILISYAVKFHSKFYGPFRVAADSAPKASELKDRATYQIDPTCPKDAFLCAQRDAREGADFLMVKPGLPYLDLLKTLSDQIQKPWLVYQVSGEYAALDLLVQQKLMPPAAGHVETWIAFVRAGANGIITYGARYGKKWISEVF